MNNENYKVRRFVSEYSNDSEILIAEYELKSFNLEAFRKELGEEFGLNPMYDSYQIKMGNVEFFNEYLQQKTKMEF